MPIRGLWAKVALVCWGTAGFALAAAELPLMPAPEHVERGDGVFAIDGHFHVRVCGVRSPVLERSAKLFIDRLERSTGIPMPLPMRSGSCDGQPSPQVLRIEAHAVVGVPELGDDESYKLEVTAETAHLSAATSTGVLRGLATFEQLIAPTPSGFAVPAVSIEDRPRFPWRGLMLDASRHWMPLDVVKRNIEALAAVKMNVFHWHLTDDQGFRVESRLYPRLQQVGSDGHYYTQAEVRQVVQFAQERGIRVVPEFEMPGHATALLLAYPEFGSGTPPQGIEREWGVFRPVLDPTRESTYRFLEALLGEMTALFPDPYFHIGGDEVLDTDWKENPRIQAFERAHAFAGSAELHAYFNRRVSAILAKHRKTVIGWDEVLAPGLPKNIVIQSWRGREALAATVRQGYRGLLSNGYYLDYGLPAAHHYANDPVGGDAQSLSPEEASRILGGEACMWTEYTSAETVDSRIWPRLAAIAERLWSPAGVADVDSMYARLEIVNRKLDWTGLQHRKAQQEMLARIAGEQENATLPVLANAVNALGHDDRYHSRKYNSLVPLNRLADAAYVESEWVRLWTSDARRVAEDPQASTRLRAVFETWRDAAVRPSSDLTAELVPLAGVLSQLGQAGLEALDLLAHAQPPKPGWIDSQRALLTQASNPVAEVHIAAAGVVATLVDILSPPPAHPNVQTGSAASKASSDIQHR